MHSFQTSFSSDSAISEALDHFTFFVPARNTEGSFSNAIDLAPLPNCTPNHAFPLRGDHAWSSVLWPASLHTHPLKNLTLTSGMTNVKFPSLARHFNMSPGSCCNCLGISPWTSKTRRAPLSPQNWFLLPVITCLIILQAFVFTHIFLSLVVLHPSCAPYFLPSHLPRLTPSVLYRWITALGSTSYFSLPSIHLCHCYQINLLPWYSSFSKSYRHSSSSEDRWCGGFKMLPDSLTHLSLKGGS